MPTSAHPADRTHRPARRRRVRHRRAALVLLLAWSPALLVGQAAGGAPGPARSGAVQQLPVEGAVRARFRAPEHPWSPGHRGIDLLTGPGTAVRAPAAGTVTFADVVVDRPVMTITHRDGLRSSLEPVAATVDVGSPVDAGQVVGFLDSGPWHCAPDGCLHWGVRDGDVYLDPLDLLPGAGPVVLLPVELHP